MCLKIKTDTTEILKGKFAETIAKIEGVYKEAKGDLAVEQTYTAKAVYVRAESIRESFYNDLKNLAKDIQVED